VKYNDILKFLEEWNDGYGVEVADMEHFSKDLAIFTQNCILEEFSELNLRQIICGNKVPGGYTEQQAKLAKEIYIIMKKKFGEETNENI